MSEPVPYNHTHGTLAKRPVLVSIVCIIGFVWVLFTFPGVLAPDVKRAGAIYPPLLGLTICLKFIAFVGIWYTKRWGIHLFTYVMIAQSLLLFLLNDLSFAGITVAVIMLIILFPYYRKFDINL
jgi:hypothetical protein